MIEPVEVGFHITMNNAIQVVNVFHRYYSQSNPVLINSSRSVRFVNLTDLMTRTN